MNLKVSKLDLEYEFITKNEYWTICKNENEVCLADDSGSVKFSFSCDGDVIRAVANDKICALLSADSELLIFDLSADKRIYKKEGYNFTEPLQCVNGYVVACKFDEDMSQSTLTAIDVKSLEETVLMESLSLDTSFGVYNNLLAVSEETDDMCNIIVFDTADMSKKVLSVKNKNLSYDLFAYAESYDFKSGRTAYVSGGGKLKKPALYIYGKDFAVEKKVVLSKGFYDRAFWLFSGQILAVSEENGFVFFDTETWEIIKKITDIEVEDYEVNYQSNFFSFNAFSDDEESFDNLNYVVEVL